MVNLNARHPVEHIVGFIGVVLFHILVIWLLIVFLSVPKKEQADTLPVQVQIVEVASSESAAAAAAQPPAPEMIVPPPPEIEPPPINTEAPPQPKPPPVVKKKVAKKAPPAATPSPAASSAPVGTQRQGQSSAGVGKPDRSAGSRPLNGAQIEYPPDMQAEQKEGRVIISCDVETTGSTSNCHVISSSGGQSFVKAAMKYVNSARYRPATKNGAPVKELGHRYTINFRL